MSIHSQSPLFRLFFVILLYCMATNANSAIWTSSFSAATCYPADSVSADRLVYVTNSTDLPVGTVINIDSEEAAIVICPTETPQGTTYNAIRRSSVKYVNRRDPSLVISKAMRCTIGGFYSNGSLNQQYSRDLPYSWSVITQGFGNWIHGGRPINTNIVCQIPPSKYESGRSGIISYWIELSSD